MRKQIPPRRHHLIAREERLETIAGDLVRHFTGRGFPGKAMVISIDKATAIRMYDKVQAHWKTEVWRLMDRIAEALIDEERQTIKELCPAEIHAAFGTKPYSWCNPPETG